MSAKQIHADMVQTLGGSALSYATVTRWCREFNYRRTSNEDEHAGGAPKTATTQANVDKIHDLVMKDRRLTIRYLAEVCKISFGSVQGILTAVLELHKYSARWVPRLLTPDQKRNRVTTSQRLLTQYRMNSADLLLRFVTEDECWVYHFEPELKRQSMQWQHVDSPPPRKCRAGPSAG